MLKDRDTLRKLIALLSPFKKSLALVTFFLVLLAIPSLILPLLNKTMIDNGLLKKDLEYSLYIILSIFSIHILRSASTVFNEILRTKVSANIKHTLFMRSFEFLSSVSVAYYNDKSSTKILQNIETDINNIGRICDENVFFVISQTLTLFAGLTGLLLIDIRLSVLAIIFIPIKYVLVRYFSKKNEALISRIISLFDHFAHWFDDTLNGMKDIRLFNITPIFQERFSHQTDEITQTDRKISINDGLSHSADDFLLNLLTSSVYALGAYFICNQSLTIGSLFAFITFISHVITPISSVLNLRYMISGILPSARRFFSMIEEGKLLQERDGCIALDEINTIDFTMVNCSYGTTKILDNVSFTIRKGDKIAILGKNGAGKSTIFSLIQRFHTHESGTISINEHDILDLKISPYRNLMACITQDSHLFDLSIKDNITLFRSCTQKRVDEIISECRLTDLYNDRGDTKIGKGGREISCGQRQKILIARALLIPKSLYLFDEATANLDKKSVISFYNNITRNFNDSIVIFITHDNQHLDKMDYIYFLDEKKRFSRFFSYGDFIERHPDYFTMASNAR